MLSPKLRACRAFTDQFVGGESAEELIQLGDSGVEPIEDLGEVWIFGRIDAVGLELDQERGNQTRSPVRVGFSQYGPSEPVVGHEDEMPQSF